MKREESVFDDESTKMSLTSCRQLSNRCWRLRDAPGPGDGRGLVLREKIGLERLRRVGEKNCDGTFIKVGLSL